MSAKRLLNQREGLKAGVERLLSQAEAHAAAGQQALLRRTMELLDSYLMKCREIHGDLQGHLQESELESETAHWMDFELKVVDAKARIDSCVQLVPAGSPSLKAELQEHTGVLPGPQLPRWELPAFDGNVLEFVAFWDQFDASVNSRRELTDATKFVYLKSALKGTALEAVAGLSLTAANYAFAVDILKNRFGRPNAIIQSHIVALLEMQPCSQGSAERLRCLHDKLNWHVRALCALGKDPAGQLTAAEVLLPIFKLKLPGFLRKKWENEVLTGKGEVTLDSFFQFLCNHIEVEESCNALAPMSREKTINASRARNALRAEHLPTTAMLQTSVVSEEACGTCSARGHGMAECPTFVKCTVKQRWRLAKQHRVCFVCLRKGHSSANCEARGERCNAAGCSRLHNRLLHYRNDSRRPSHGATSGNGMPPEEGNGNEVRIGVARDGKETVLLQSAQARLIGANGSMTTVTCLLDIGSQRSFIRKDLADNLGLKGNSECISILTFGSRQSRCETARRVRFCLTAVRNGAPRKWLTALCVPRICAPLQANPPLRKSWKHLQRCNLSDRYPRDPVEVDVLIGADYYYDFVGDEIRKKRADEPVAVESIFGWIVCGKTGPVTKGTTATLLCRVSEEESANLLLQRFWQLDAIGIAPEENKGSPDVECQQFERRIRFNGERYVVPLPWSSEVKLPNNYSYALQRLEQVENRMKRKPIERQMYVAAVQEYIDRGWVEEVPSAAEEGKVWYLPHHAVIRDRDSVKKCRIVFDGSACYQGLCLNDLLNSGPALQNDLLAILLRYRRFQIAVQADIEAMFLQIELQPEERDFVRFLWRGLEPREKLMTMRFTRICFGLRSSPFLAMAVVRKLALDEAARFRGASAEVLRNMYVDDLLVSFSAESDALSVSTEAIALLNAGGFRLHKWRSNSATVMQNLAKCSQVQPGHDGRALGMLWFIEADTLSYPALEVSRGTADTKRSMIKVASRVYDPLGLLAPYTVLFKVILQESWKMGIGWDEVLPASIEKRWNTWKDELPVMPLIKVPRWVGILTKRDIQQVELHVFCDASEAAYGAALYLRLVTESQRIDANLIVAKSRVAPVKRISIPRLELLAALVGARLARFVKKELDVEIHRTVCWSDSMVVLCWIRSSPARWKTFVRNRIEEIQSVTDPSCWKYCPTKDNVADYISRGQALRKLKDNECWWHGPKWLRQTEDEWPSELLSGGTEEDQEAKLTSVQVNLTSEDEPDRLSPEVVGQFERLVRVTAWCLRFGWNAKCGVEQLRRGALSVDELRKAEKIWLMKVQRMAFSKELEALKKAKCVSANSCLHQLDPFLDGEGLIRVGGRLQLSDLCLDSRHQIVLPREGRFVYLLARCCHERQLHAGPEATLSVLRQRYWILKGRSLVKKVVRSCTICRRVCSKPFVQKMAPLPEGRITPAYPFERTGVDFAGPLYIRRGRRVAKAYVCVFTCMVIRAIHLELVSTMTTDEFILALRRFISRRGRPTCIQSDNFRSFKGADRMIKQLFENDSFGRIRDDLSKDRITWTFITPRAPWSGGYWERLIRSVKVALKKVLGKALVCESVLSTLLCEIEARINARPLTFVSDDVNDAEALTPFHFLTGRRFEDVPVDATKGNIGPLYGHGLRKRWQLHQTLLSHLWKRWRQEYVVALTGRSKWFFARDGPTVGDVVLIAEDNLPRQRWKLGRIVQIHPSGDGLVRSATVRTEDGEVMRSVRSLHLLEPAAMSVMA